MPGRRALQPFNIDAKLNGAYVALGLIYGRGDFAKTLEVSIRAGQDSDRNPSSAAGILGVILGYDRIPDVWKAGIPALANTRFAVTQYSFNEVVASTMARAQKVIEGAGGKVTATDVAVPPQEPQAPVLEQWEAQAPRERIDNDYWHVTGLSAGKHAVRIEVRADADARSIGKKVQIERAIVYGSATNQGR